MSAERGKNSTELKLNRAYIPLELAWLALYSTEIELMNRGMLLVKPDLIRRRRRMLTLLGLGNSLQAVVSALAEEFNCKEATLYADYERISTWAPVVEQDQALTAMIKARLDYLNREALEIMQSIQNNGSTVKEKLIKIGAINAALKITAEQIKLGQELGLIEKKTMEIISNFHPIEMPFTCDPDIKRLLLERAEEQRAEKARREAATDEKAKCNR